MKSHFFWFARGLGILSLLSLSLTSQEPTEDSSPYVTCWLDGQLGNEICQIATTLAYAWDHGCEAIFPELNKTECNISYNKDRFFFRLNSSDLPRPFKHCYIEQAWWEYAPLPIEPDQYLRGVFFCWKHFHHHRDKLVELFAPSQEVLNYLHEKYGSLIEHPKTVSIHVRTYNEEMHKTFIPFAGISYYAKAIELFPEDSLFVVFSDRINWCKHHFAQFNKNMVFIEGNDHIQDFFLMSMMKGHILANSSFSWWSTYLDTKPNTRIVAPRYWYFVPWRRLYPQSETDYLLFPEWELVDLEPCAPYPEDMKHYDIFSQSIDTQ